jgi:hypothetical protein
MAGHSEQRDLNTVQRWLQSVIAHPGGVEAGVDSDKAQRIIHLKRGELEQVVRRSRNLSAEQRLGIYANAYYARLLECLRESFPVLARAMGREVFDEFAFEYLQRYPSRSYTLGRLGDRFADFLNETRPDRPPDGSASPSVGWPDFLIDLARLEWTIEQVFDGPGVESRRQLTLEDLRAVPQSRWLDAKLVLVVCAKLIEFRYAVDAYYTAARRAKEGEVVLMPEPSPEYVCLTRRDFVVRRVALTRPQYMLLQLIEERQTIGQALAAAGNETDSGDDELAAMIKQWFADWTALGLFAGIEV